MLVEKKEPRFKKGPLVTRLEFEAACAVIAQASVNGQNGGCEDRGMGRNGDWVFDRLIEDFKDPLTVKAELEEQQAEFAEKMAKIKAIMDVNAQQLLQIGKMTGQFAKDERIVGVDYGKVEAQVMAKYAEGDIVAVTQSSVRKIEGVYGVKATQSGRIPTQGQAPCAHDCAYSGFNFHTKDCDKTGPCK